MIARMVESYKRGLDRTRLMFVNKLWIYACIFLMFPPKGVIDYLFGYGTVLPYIFGALAVVMTLIRFLGSKRRLPQYVLWYGAFFIVCLVSTVLNSSYFYAAIFFCMKLIAFMLLYEMSVVGNPLRFVRCLRNYFVLILIISLYFLVFYKGQFGYTSTGNNINFYLDDNQQIYTMLACICCSIYIDYEVSSKISIKTFATLGVCLALVLVAWVGKAIPVLIIVSVFLLLDRLFKISQLLKPKHLIIGLIILFLALVFQWFDIAPVRYLIEDVLHKRMDLSYRVYIWQASWGMIAESPLIGHGTGKVGILAGFVSIYEYIDKNVSLATHNFILEILMQVGVIGFAFYVVFISKLLGNKKKKVANEDKCQYNVIAFVTFCMFVMLLLSYFIYNPEIYIPLLILRLIKQKGSLNYNDTAVPVHKLR